MSSPTSSKVAQVPVGARGKGTDVPNPILDLCFHLTEDLRYSVARDHRVTRGVARDMKTCKEENACANCCFQMALLAQCRKESEVSVINRLEWGPGDDSAVIVQAQSVSTRTGRGIEVFTVQSGGMTSLYSHAGNGPTFRVLIVHLGLVEGEWQRHAVPMFQLPLPGTLGRYRRNCSDCEKYMIDRALQTMLETDDEECSSEVGGGVLLHPPSEAQLVADLESRAEEGSRAIGVQTDGPAEWVFEDCLETIPVADRTPEQMVRSRRDVWMDEGGWGTQTLQEPPKESTFLMTAFGRQAYVSGYPEGMACYVNGRGKRFSNERPFCELARGWELSEGEVPQTNVDKWIEGWIATPTLALATIQNVRKYGTTTTYWFDGRPGRFDNGGNPDYNLSCDDKLQSNGIAWHFEEHNIHWYRKVYAVSYRLVADSGDVQRAGLLEAIKLDYVPTIIHNPFVGAVVLETGSLGDQDAKNNILWRLEHGSEKDSAVAANLAYARNKSAAGENLPAVETARAIREICRPYKGTLIGFGGRYDWGYCYSCGVEYKGKYEMRLCKSCNAGGMSTLGAAIGRGEQVLTASNPVCYPGVVERLQQHPPMKVGTLTTERDGAGEPVLGGRVRVFDVRKRAMTYHMVRGMLTPGKGPWLGGIGLDGASPFITSGGVQPLVEAVLFRVFKELDLPDAPRRITEGVFDRAGALAESPLLLGKFLGCRPAVLTILDYIMSNPQARRRKALLQAWRDWDDRGEHSKDWEFISAFVKRENLPWFTPKNGVLNSAEKNYVARLIQAPHDETHIVAGRYLKPLVQELKKAWHKDNWIFYGSAKPEALTQWLGRIRGCESFFWSDYSAFDATFSEGTWRMIEGFYRKIYPDAEHDFWEVMRIWRTPKGRMHLRREQVRVEYDAGVCNCSGRDDTALANALFNGVALAIAFAAALSGKTVLEVTEGDVDRASHLCIISVVGDDSLVGCNFDVKPYEDSIVKALREFGLMVKAESSRHLHAVTYLGMMPYLSAKGVRWGPTIGRRLFKLFWMSEKKPPASWVRGVCQQTKLLRHVPLVWELADQADWLLKGKSITRQKRDDYRPWHFFEEEQPPWDEVTVTWLCQRYPGLTKEMIDDDIKIIRNITRLPAVVRLQSLEIILQTDDL